ncbi:large ribosomal subunit protein mL65 [Diretmus argenteus]
MAARTRLLPLQSVLFNRNLPPFRHERLVHTEAAVREPAYPPIVPSLTAKSKAAQRRRLEERLERVRAAAVPDKLSLLTRTQRKKYVVIPQTYARNADRWYQHFTKTAYIPGLPEKFSLTTGETERGETEQGDPPPPAAQNAPGFIGDDAFAEIRSLVTSAILQERWYMKKRKPALYKEQEHFVAPLLRNLVTGLTRSLSTHNPLLLQSSTDLKPQVNFYWMRGQRTIAKGHRKRRVETIKFQIDDEPHSQIRIQQQLPEFTTLESSYAAEVPEVTFSPDVMPLFRRQYDNNVFTGAKVPDLACYGHTQFHLVPDRYRRDNMARSHRSDQVEAFLRANGLASLFAWTGAQAMYQGFWSHDDVTRPFVSQAVITDGQFFSFFCYQLNTLALSADVDADNLRKNLLWGTESLRLYEGVQDGAVVGLDDNVLKLLVQFLLNKP